MQEKTIKQIENCGFVFVRGWDFLSCFIHVGSHRKTIYISVYILYLCGYGVFFFCTGVLTMSVFLYFYGTNAVFKTTFT